MVTATSPDTHTWLLSGRLSLWAGIGLVFLGPILYLLQIRAKLLSAPWYVPVLAAAGVALIVLALVGKPTMWRIAALVLCGLLAGAESYFVVSLSKVPAYTGPVSVGATIPAFRTALADGAAFDQDSLRGEQNTALVFFRGRA